MEDKARLELLKALREHGQTIQKMAGGGEMLSGPSVSTSGTSKKTGGFMGGLNKFLGTQNDFSADGANLQAGTNATQLNTAYDQSQQGLENQQSFLNALKAQNGLGNQSNVYNQFQNVASGQGPNPAQAMLDQATGQNVANQAALMASQRGASVNPGLVAKMAAQQGANLQQNAIGQGANLQAQQSLAAMNNMANIAQNQVANQANATTGYNQAAQNEQNILQDANSAYNTANVGMQSNLNNVNAQVSQGNQQAGNNLLGGVMKGLGSITGLFADGGEVPMSMTAKYFNNYSDGGSVDDSLKSGGDVPGKPEVDGQVNTEKNDTVPALLSPGEIVIPRSITQGKNPADGAKKFVEALLKKKASESPDGVKKMADGGFPTAQDMYSQADQTGQNLSNMLPDNPFSMPGGMKKFIDDQAAGFKSLKVLPPVASKEEDAGTVLDLPPEKIPAPPSAAPQPASFGQPQQSAPSAAPKMGDDTDKWMKQYQSGYGQQVAGVKDLAQAQQKMGEAQAKIYADQEAQAKERLQSYQTEYNNLNSERTALQQDIQSSKIDPKHFVNNMSTGSKISTAIGMLLGGIGQGFIGGSNPAEDFLKKHIEDDIDAQKQSLGNKKSLLEANLRQFGNLDQATQMTRVMLNDVMTNKINQVASLNAGPEAMARAKMMTGQLQAQNSQIMSGLAEKQAQKKLMAQITGGGTGSEDQFRQQTQLLRSMGKTEEAKDLESRYVPGSGLATTSEGGKGLREMQSMVNSAKQNVQSLREIVGKTGKSMNPGLRTRADSIQKALVGALRVPITGPGSMSEGDRQLLQDMVGDVTSATSLDSNSLQRLKTIDDMLNGSYNNMLKANGLKPGADTARIEVRGGVKYQQVPGGWKKVQ